MSRKPPPPAAAPPRRAAHVVIPTDWTPEQALAVFELLDQLRDTVATLYLNPMQTLLEQQQGRTANAIAIAPDRREAAGDDPAF